MCEEAITFVVGVSNPCCYSQGDAAPAPITVQTAETSGASEMDLCDVRGSPRETITRHGGDAWRACGQIWREGR